MVKGHFADNEKVGETWNSVCAHIVSLYLRLLFLANTMLQSYSKLVLNIKCILRFLFLPLSTVTL